MLAPLVLILLVCSELSGSLEINGISAVRFALNTSLFPQGRDGVLEVKYNGAWSSICNFGFDHIAASTACFMLGYPPYGVPILNSYLASAFPTRISTFNCTGRLTLGPNPPNPFSVHLGYCEYTSEIPSACYNHRRDVAIACLEPMHLRDLDTPSSTTFAPVNCPRNSKEVRLTYGDEKSGRLEVKHPKTGVWGTVCADGFGTNEAKAVCRMLCSSSDDLAYAHAVIDKFKGKNKTVGNKSEEEAMPIHLARIFCPVWARSLNDCSLGGGWGSARGCTHALDVGVVCGPEVTLTPARMPIESNLTCDDEMATVRFKRAQVGKLDSSRVHLNRSLPKDCSLTFINDNNGTVDVVLPMDKCGGTYERSNTTTLAIHLSLVLNLTSGRQSAGRGQNEGGTEDEVYVLPLTCLVSRTDSVHSAVRAIATSYLRPLVASRPSPPVRLAFFADRMFQRRVSDRLNVLPYRRVFAKIFLDRPESNKKLILRNCWLSNTGTATNSSIPVIRDGCPVNAEINLLPISRSAVGFSFETAYFKRASKPTNDGSLLQLFAVCQTRLCQMYEITPECIQNYCA